jgi:hypothetical protein
MAKQRVQFGGDKSAKISWKLRGLINDIEYIRKHYEDKNTNKKLLTIMKREVNSLMKLNTPNEK